MMFKRKKHIKYFCNILKIYLTLHLENYKTQIFLTWSLLKKGNTKEKKSNPL